MASHRSTPRTPSGKGKRQQAYHKATWDEESTQILLQLVVKEIEAGNWPHMSITPNGYRSLCKTFEAATGRLHSPKQLKNKYNLLKTEWRAWCKLMDCRKGPIGIGFDQQTGLFNASDDWWAKMEKGLAPEDELLHFGVMLMEVPNNWEMVMSIPTDQGIIGWLRAKQQDKDRSGGVTLASMNDDDDHDPQMDEILEGWQILQQMASADEFKLLSNAPEYRYPDMRDRDDLAALDDAMMPGDDDVEMAQLRARIRAELVAIWRNAG
ncbi:L10-interacting MYB domain-containing protein [Camellia lanceoleosa]|uniref:L10-interacting MYB domain-containing protein n=1 Tax=Camellia lanceoleosa TaxID=1840588 RepID=A0ACC0GYM7_9ERIC|nr:L10-interacting MYB domain-containing protein [Camellia lanceoleosa]